MTLLKSCQVISFGANLLNTLANIRWESRKGDSDYFCHTLNQFNLFNLKTNNLLIWHIFRNGKIYSMTLHKLHIFGVNMCLLNAHICVICLSAFFFFISDGRVSGWSGLACQCLSYVSYIVSRSLCQLYFFQFVNSISFSLSTLVLSLYNTTVFTVGSVRLDKLG